MIITRLMGGLANQIFQWAAAQTIADKYDTECFCDLSHFVGYQSLTTEDRIKETPESPVTPWGLELNKLNLELKFAQGNGGLPTIKDNFNYRPLTDNSYLDGFWQSEKYFADNAENIRSRLRMSDTKRNEINNLYPFLKDETVSLHVRRGDYVNLQNVHPCQSVEYYDKALEIIGCDKPNILVFSDDIDWCKQNFKYDNIYFSEAQDNVTDLYSMSFCSHNIIANSSFSWWGAWLNENQNKKIVAPSKWFANDTVSSNIIPNDWIKI